MGKYLMRTIYDVFLNRFICFYFRLFYEFPGLSTDIGCKRKFAWRQDNTTVHQANFKSSHMTSGQTSGLEQYDVEEHGFTFESICSTRNMMTCSGLLDIFPARIYLFIFFFFRCSCFNGCLFSPPHAFT